MGSPKRYSPQVPRLGALGCQMRHESYRTLSRPTSCLALNFQSRVDTDPGKSEIITSTPAWQLPTLGWKLSAGLMRAWLSSKIRPFNP